MSEIEKMYENAGVKKINTHQSEIDNGDPRFTGISHSDSYIKYPSFTAEKQIELIKWLARKGLIQINYSSHQCYQFNSFRIGGDYKSNLNEALASHCNNLWQDLTTKEKQQVKGILE